MRRLSVTLLSLCVVLLAVQPPADAQQAGQPVSVGFRPSIGNDEEFFFQLEEPRCAQWFEPSILGIPLGWTVSMRASGSVTDPADISFSIGINGYIYFAWGFGFGSMQWSANGTGHSIFLPIVTMSYSYDPFTGSPEWLGFEGYAIELRDGQLVDGLVTMGFQLEGFCPHPRG